MSPTRQTMRALGLGLLVLLSATAAGAKELPPRPSQFVYDEADWLSPAQERQLSRALAQFERETSNQIVLAVMNSLEDEDLADFSQRLAEHWGIGQGDRDNGILLAVYAQERLIDIEVGYGLEAVVTDAIASQIRTQILVPRLRAGERARGLQEATAALMAASRGEFEGSGRTRADGSRGKGGRGFPLWLIWIVLALLFGGGGRRGRRSWVGPVLYGAMLGSAGGRRGGGFGGGGFGGGGFSGGGGSFGGGGARGGW